MGVGAPLYVLYCKKSDLYDVSYLLFSQKKNLCECPYVLPNRFKSSPRSWVGGVV